MLCYSILYVLSSQSEKPKVSGTIGQNIS
ncbi:hypothetical protein X801_03642 [Opisthorchis viverrini]|uniref:Uncharacterized protein n=1 Tax=Opisthorchis viverrini TaxID=6198 RepID=A0A1S8X192_OPIVI|nr:hypothetical protein X801_03642 [Opisthorchis viverrini]